MIADMKLTLNVFKFDFELDALNCHNDLMLCCYLSGAGVSISKLKKLGVRTLKLNMILNIL